VGVPGSGKSTWIAQQNFDLTTTVVTGTDHYVDMHAAETGQTFDQAIYNYIDTASSMMYADVARAVKNNLDLVWDMASITPWCRTVHLKSIPEHYYKIAVGFPIPAQAEWTRRLNNRAGKNIPAFVLKRLPVDFVLPSKDEGFDEVLIIQGE
jgi:predicted deacylase